MKQINLRIDDGLHAKLVKLAEDDVRSLHNFIEKALRDVVAASTQQKEKER